MTNSARIPERKRRKLTGRGGGHSFIMMPHYMLRSPQFYAVGKAHSLLMFIAGQYNGSNNGNLSATKNMVKELGVCTPSKLHELTTLLLEAGFIVKTRHGIKKLCNLYAITWYPIDECPGQGLEIGPGPARNDWRKIEPLAPSRGQTTDAEITIFGPQSEIIGPHTGPKRPGEVGFGPHAGP
ncbi:hypothetical protein [Stenotrophomonas humi]|uniref:hypothetical protein n=1 Tax=Stenotrophomonas humi TaxID=405444 RepID=UPI00128F806D|nr:hypothetical protein [Stenotrophomonas humi]